MCWPKPHCLSQFTFTFRDLVKVKYHILLLCLMSRPQPSPQSNVGFSGNTAWSCLHFIQASTAEKELPSECGLLWACMGILVLNKTECLSPPFGLTAVTETEGKALLGNCSEAAIVRSSYCELYAAWTGVESSISCWVSEGGHEHQTHSINLRQVGKLEAAFSSRVLT